ncbi:MAG: iron-containing alcohol dehydrogenase [Pseudomonadota bacterium]
MTSPVRATTPRNWNAIIDDILAGRWIDPETDRPANVPCKTIYLAEDLDGAEADLIASMDLGDAIAVVSDSNTRDAQGARIAKATRPHDDVVLQDRVSPNEATVAALRERTKSASGIVAVGSGSLTDACKFAAHLDGKPMATFGTAASMNGYAAASASITLQSGLKASLPAAAPRGLFLDLKVSAEAPSWLSAAGLGDSLCRPTAQIDWWASHRLFKTPYSRTPYVLQEADEPDMFATADALTSRDMDAVGVLQRVLTLCGLGVCFTGTSNHGSMGEHLISHWLDMFAGRQHPGTVHGQQVGVASLAMARLQAQIIAMDDPPRIKPSGVDELDLARRYGPELGRLCAAEMKAKALNRSDVEDFNRHLADIWPKLRQELRAFALPVADMERALRDAGGATTGRELGLSPELWGDALRHGREIRRRWSFLDLAADAGLLEPFIEQEIAR